MAFLSGSYTDSIFLPSSASRGGLVDLLLLPSLIRTLTIALSPPRYSMKFSPSKGQVMSHHNSICYIISLLYSKCVQGLGCRHCSRDIVLPTTPVKQFPCWCFIHCYIVLRKIHKNSVCEYFLNSDIVMIKGIVVK